MIKVEIAPLSTMAGCWSNVLTRDGRTALVAGGSVALGNATNWLSKVTAIRSAPSKSSPSSTKVALRPNSAFGVPRRVMVLFI